MRLRGWIAAHAGWLSHLLYFCGVGGILILDQLSKAWVVATLPAYRPVEFFEWLAPIFSFTYVQNTGVAFGLFPGLGDLFALLSMLVVLAILAFRRTLPSADLWIHGALAMVTGGALGNVMDRVLRGYVVDFIDVNVWPLHTWPVFNVADAAIVVGVIVLLLDSFMIEQEVVRSDG